MAEFSAMGNDCRIVAPSDELAEHGRATVDRLEHLWSRFLPTSEISALNRADGALCIVSAETYRLIEHAEHAREATGGWFNPLQLSQLEELGYRQSWRHGPPVDTALPSTATTPACEAPIELHPNILGVQLPAGARFDPGGLGKGLAGDIVAEQLAALGASAAQIELGGDVRVLGEPWDGDEWTIHVERLDNSGAPLLLRLAAGGAATSGTGRRRWRRGGIDLHHLLNPNTGWPADTDVIAATVTASTLAWAEIFAKTAVICGQSEAASRLSAAGLTAVLHVQCGQTISLTVVGQEGAAA